MDMVSNRYFLRGLFILVATTFLFSQQLYGQVVAKLPDDPRVKHGKTANGLSYIIIKNEGDKGFAHFCIAQKVGTALEDNSTRGSLLMLEQLATKGTRNFAGNSITEYLKQLGVNNNKITFDTDIDKTIYTIKDVPVGRQNTIDSSLLILYNWMCAINIDEEDMIRERSLLRTRVLSEWGAEKRLTHQQIKELFPSSPYTNTLSPENLNSIRNLNSKDLRTFYYDWCRPDLQCVVVVGDVDIAKVETQIKSIFATIPKPIKVKSKKNYTPQKWEGIKSIVLKDREYNQTTVEITFFKEPLKEEYRNSNLPYIQDYMDDATLFLLEARLRDGVLKNGLPIYDITTERGEWQNIPNTNAYTISYHTVPNNLYSSVSFVSEQIHQIVKKGFGKEEFNSTIDLYWKRLESEYDNRFTFGNDLYMQRALKSFFNGYTLASTEMNFEIMKKVLFALTHENLNEYAKALLEQQDNIAITCKVPQTNELNDITNEKVQLAYTESSANSSYIESQQLVAWPMVTLNKEISIVKEEDDEITKEKVITLNNGAKVILKDIANGSDTINFKAISKGGFSLIKGVNIGNQQFFNNILNMSKTSDIAVSDIRRLYAYNHIDISSRITQNCEEVVGYSLPNNLDKLLDAIYLTFSERSEDENAYEIYKQQMIYLTQYSSIAPDVIFADSVNYYNNSNKQYVASPTVSEIESYNYKKLLSELNSRFENGGDFIFIFTGKDITLQKDLIVKYIGNLRGSSQKENWVIAPNYRTKGNIQRRFLIKMRVPRSFVNITFSAPCELQKEDYILAQITKEYIREFFNEELDKVASNLKIESELENYPENIFHFNAIFETDSSSVNSTLRILDYELGKICNQTISQRDFEKVKHSLSHTYSTHNRDGKMWIEYLVLKYLYGNDIYADNADIENITLKQFADFVSNFYKKGNSVCIIMDGTTADVQTERLLRENEFIRDYFKL